MSEQGPDLRSADSASLAELFGPDDQAAAVFAASYVGTFEEFYAMLLSQGVDALDEDLEAQEDLLARAGRGFGLEGDVAGAASVALAAGIFEVAERTGLAPAKLGAGVREAL